MSTTLTATAAALGLAANIGVDLIWRRGRARSPRRSRDDRGSSALLAFLGVVIIPGSIVLGVLVDPGPTRIALPVTAFFVAVLLAGTVLRIYAMRELGESFSRTLVVREAQKVVDTGPYRWVRHPGYLAQLLVFPSLAGLFTASWLAFVMASVLMLAGYVYRIRVEEAMLVAEMGEPYRAYQERTRRLLPGIY